VGAVGGETACALLPIQSPALAEAIVAGGGRLADVSEAECLVWSDPLDADSLLRVLEAGPGIRWVQLPFAGVDRFLTVLDHERIWTSAKGAYAPPVAEHALALGLAGLRVLPARARAREWGPQAGQRLMGARVTILGGGAITRALLTLLEPFQVEATVVRRRPSPLPGAGRVLGPEKLDDALPGASLVVLALALTAETKGIIARRQLECLGPQAWLVNVARGAHVVTDDLVVALAQGVIGGAALDVTDPEPLPTGHPLWDLENCLVTPHTANTWEMAEPVLAQRVRENLTRYRRGEELLGIVDARLGY
jgi:phosphoglycerate dehydrogenase-like enzyme